MKRFNCLTDKRECIITPPLVNMAINEVINAFKREKGNVQKGLIESDVINKIIWS